MNRRVYLSFVIITFSFCIISAQQLHQSKQEIGKVQESDFQNVMSEAYWNLWNPEVQAKIDHDIEKYRKADAVLRFDDFPAKTEIEVEQISHDFIFGANIFNFNQLGSAEYNSRYKELFGSLFNAATIPFYWKSFEMQPNRPRFREEYWDTQKYWNNVKDPSTEPHWRRPATDPIVEFCERKGIRMHGHTIIWANRLWQHPEWLFERFCPEVEKMKISQFSKEELYKLSPSQIEALAPVYFMTIKHLFEKRVLELADYYEGRLQSWDVVNESSVDFHGESVTGDAVCKSARDLLMPGNYVYEAFKTANLAFPENVLLNINDYTNNDNYVNQIKDLIAQGSRIDIMGSQMHLFNPQQCLDIASGKPIESPDQVWSKMSTIAKAELPIHLSEITITSPGDDDRGREIQAIITRNLYRQWFSIEQMMGITWWNVVDSCGAPGETVISGLFTRNMEPKPSFYALDRLINDEWRTQTKVTVGKDGITAFRGFKGLYRVSWKNKAGEEQVAEFYLKQDGDGLQAVFKPLQE